MSGLEQENNNVFAKQQAHKRFNENYCKLNP